MLQHHFFSHNLQGSNNYINNYCKQYVPHVNIYIYIYIYILNKYNVCLDSSKRVDLANGSKGSLQSAWNSSFAKEFRSSKLRGFWSHVTAPPRDSSVTRVVLGFPFVSWALQKVRKFKANDSNDPRAYTAYIFMSFHDQTLKMEKIDYVAKSRNQSWRGSKTR